MTALEKIRSFIESYPGAGDIREFQIDFTDQIPANGGLFPAGLVEVERRKDITGRVTVTNQYNFALYCVLEKAAWDDAGAAANAQWLMDFQEWVQEQSAKGLAPTFGDRPREERITAQNGVLYETDGEGTATYMVQLSVQFKKNYEVENKWLI